MPTHIGIVKHHLTAEVWKAIIAENPKVVKILLRFDAWQRYTQVSQILHDTFVDRPRSVLDVGGGTGQSLDLPEGWTQLGVDVHPAGIENFVRGSADRLPFRDDSVDIVVSLDTLEHLPEDARDRAVAEIMRVARESVVIAGPFNIDGVREAEQAVDTLHRRLTGEAHRWLSEHLAAPLPSLERTETLLREGGYAVSAYPSGYLPVWLLLMTFSQIIESREDSFDTAEELDRIYRERVYPFDQMEPAYRTILVALKEETRLNSPAGQGDPTKMAQGLCELLSRSTSILGPALPDEAAGESSDIDFRLYAERLEKAVETWETAYGEALALAEEGHRRMAELERRRSFRLYRWLMRRLGKSV